jgi:L-threonylcarbamoyladenylate synthase
MQEELQRAFDAIKGGKTILCPTDTVWAICSDSRFDAAVELVHRLKDRSEEKPLVILIAELGQLSDYVQKVPDIAWDIVEFSEKPLTVVFPKGKNVSSKILAADGSIAIRLVKDEFCQKLIRKLGRPVVATSANRTGQATPRYFEDVDPAITSKVDYVVRLPHKSTTHYRQSTIIRLEVNGEIKFIRN